VARAGRRDEDLEPAVPTGDAVEAGIADPLGQDVRRGLLRLRQQHVESVCGGSRHPVRLPSVLADDLRDAARDDVRASGCGGTDPDHHHRRRAPVTRHARLLVAERGLPVRPGIERDRAADRVQTVAPPWGSSSVDRRAVEERLDDLADTLVMVLGRHDEPWPAPSGRAASGSRRLVGQLGHGKAQV
jgi:hypothetical protein